MNKKQFDEIILIAAHSSKSKLFVIGSQAVYGSGIKIIPAVVQTSDEVDICPETMEDAESIEIASGRDTAYWESHGVYAHALEDVERHILTMGWRERLLPYSVKDKSSGSEC